MQESRNLAEMTSAEGSDPDRDTKAKEAANGKAESKAKEKVTARTTAGKRDSLPKGAPGNRQGQQYPEEIKQEALARMSVSNNINDVARVMGLPSSTLRCWKAREARKKTPEELAQLQLQRKAAFIDRAWDIIDRAQSLVLAKLEAAQQSPDKADLIRLRDLATTIGVNYDKQALANEEATTILAGGVAIAKFEDL